MNSNSRKHQTVMDGWFTPYREAGALLIVEDRKTMKAPQALGGHSYDWQRREIHAAAKALRINVVASTCELWQPGELGNRPGLTWLVEEAEKQGWRWIIVPTQAYLGLDPKERKLWEHEIAMNRVEVIEANHDCEWCE